MRIDDCKPKAIIAASCGIEPSRVVHYKPLLDAAIPALRQIERQTLDAEAAVYRAEQNRKLRADGLVSELTLKASEVEAKKAQIDPLAARRLPVMLGGIDPYSGSKGAAGSADNVFRASS